MRFQVFSFAAAALALAATGCSDPPPLIADGAWTVSFQPSSTDPMGHCMIAGHNTTVGEVKSDMRTTVMKDGEEGSTLSCAVVGSGTFNVQADSSFKTSHLFIGIDAISKGATKMAPVPGQVTYSSQNTAGNGYNNPTKTPCDFWFESGTPEGVDAGKIWVAFKCDQMAQAMSTCSIKQGYAIFENCSTKPLAQ